MADDFPIVKHEWRDHDAIRIAPWVVNGQLMTADIARHVDGTPYNTGDAVRCDSCGQMIRLYLRGGNVIAEDF